MIFRVSNYLPFIIIYYYQIELFFYQFITFSSSNAGIALPLVAAAPQYMNPSADNAHLYVEHLRNRGWSEADARSFVARQVGFTESHPFLTQAAHTADNVELKKAGTYAVVNAGIGAAAGGATGGPVGAMVGGAGGALSGFATPFIEAVHSNPQPLPYHLQRENFRSSYPQRQPSRRLPVIHDQIYQTNY